MIESISPNIIFILADQMRGDCLSAAGHPVVETPNLDHLAAQGTRFDHAYSAVPSCLPARATIMTGMDQWHTGILGMGRGQGPIPNDFPHTMAGTLGKAGYQTHLVGKGHFSPERADMGFQSRELDESGRLIGDGQQDEYRTWFQREAGYEITPDDHGVFWNSWMARPWHTEEYLHPTAWTMNRSLHFLAQRDFSRPFFLNISFARPHSPYVPPQPYFDLYDRAATPDPSIGEWAAMHDNPRDAADVNAWRGRLSERRIHRARAGYYGEITFIDSQIGRLVNWLSRHQPETLANTWIIFTSDHGDMVGDHHLWRKTYAYEGSARVPLIIKPPQHQASLGGNDEPPSGNRNVADEVVELRDIMPTILHAANIPNPPTVQGKSLLPLTSEASTNWRDYIHGEHCWCYSPEQEMHYVTNGKRKFIWLPRLGISQYFNLDVDPGECHNLIAAPDYATEIEQWRGRLLQTLSERECGWVRDGQLYCPEGDQPMVSPFRDSRYQGG